jgi:membrane fusion protein, heavy metal efflux system
MKHQAITRRCAVGTLATGLLLVLSGCGKTPTVAADQQAGSAAASSAADSPAVDYVLPADSRGVATARVEARQLPDYLEIAARIEADPTRVVHVFAPVSGRLISVTVRPSDHVSQGQTLAVLASSDVAAARAAYRQAVADNEVKKKALTRAEDLYQHSAIAAKDYQQAQADAQMSTATLESALERLQLLNVEPAGSSDQIKVLAPRAGVVIDLGAAAGEFSKSLDNSSPLCTLADLSTVWALGDVYEKDLASVKTGEAADVRINAYLGQTWRGRVAAISDVVDPNTRTLKIRVVLPNANERLKPEMFGAIRLLRSTQLGVAAPATAVLREGAAAYIFVQRAPGHFERRAVTLGRSFDHDQVEVVSGLRPGDTILIQGAGLLQATASS